MKVLVTGAAGFIGYHLADTLIQQGHEVVGLDNINDYYDPKLKYDRLEKCGISREAIEFNHLCRSSAYPNYQFVRMNLEDKSFLSDLFRTQHFDIVCNLAAQAGVRYSLENPDAYISSNIAGFLNLLECCRNYPVKHFVYASSSSVYGLNSQMPFSTADAVDHPVSLYAATKKSNELMAHTYSHLFKIPTTGLRFFTVYGPWGRPDMSPILFANAIVKGTPLKVFNEGRMKRDFTYIDDIVDGIMRVLFNPSEPNNGFDTSAPDSSSSSAPYRIFNIGNSKPTKLIEYIATLENAFGKEANKVMMPMQPGDVVGTYSDITPLAEETGYKPQTPLNEGIRKFVEWYNEYYNS